MREIVVPPDEPRKKLENFLKKRFPVGYVSRLFRKNGVRLNGKRARPETIVSPGDRVQIYIRFEQSSKVSVKATVDHLDLDVVFEDKDLLVINKPAGLAVHEGKKISKRQSVLGQLAAKYRNERITPKLVHRLDKETSGLLIVAKSDNVAEELETLFEEAKVGKNYLSLLVGCLPQDVGRIDLSLPGREGKPVRAATRFKVEKRFSETTLVRVTIETGRMHQIRLHFSILGYPVVMDDQHGHFEFNKRFRKQYGLRRQFLHARSLTLEYRGKKRAWSAPLPDDLKRTLALLEKSATQ
jgi:23S rRNA pseudouridine955/2504/2580 synthase